jgi:hypothetical protein
MLVIGDVKCLHCGWVAGCWVGARGARLTVSGLKDESGARAGGTEELIRCGRCDGPVFLDDASPVTSTYRLRRIRRLREQIAALDAEQNRAA